MLDNKSPMHKISYMLYLFIIKSLTDTFKAQVLFYEEDYMVTNTASTASMKDGPTLLKRVNMLTYI